VPDEIFYLFTPGALVKHVNGVALLEEKVKYFAIVCLFLTAIGLTPGGSSIVHIDTQTVHRIQRTEHT
jgi:hypothetical protein